MKDLIARLDPGSLTSFVEGLVSAEAGRLRMSPTTIVMSGAITEADGGLDGLLHDVPPDEGEEQGSPIPAGTVGLQIKATREKTPSAFELPVSRTSGPACDT